MFVFVEPKVEMLLNIIHISLGKGLGVVLLFSFFTTWNATVFVSYILFDVLMAQNL